MKEYFGTEASHWITWMIATWFHAVGFREEFCWKRLMGWICNSIHLQSALMQFVIKYWYMYTSLIIKINIKQNRSYRPISWLCDFNDVIFGFLRKGLGDSLIYHKQYWTLEKIIWLLLNTDFIIFLFWYTTVN